MRKANNDILSVTLIGMEKVNITKKEFKKYISQFSGIKTYNEFGNVELVVYTLGYKWIGAKDINTNEFWITSEILKKWKI